jgi:hypothetical protein
MKGPSNLVIEFDGRRKARSKVMRKRACPILLASGPVVAQALLGPSSAPLVHESEEGKANGSQGDSVYLLSHGHSK